MRSQKISTKENSKLSNEIDKLRVPKHIAIIMDGNGRWASKKGLPRSFGHNKGVNVLKEIIKVSKNLDCQVLTVYAFSTENWTRPSTEVDFLINLFEKVLKKEITEIHQESIKIKFIGDLSPFPKALKSIINSSETLTKNNKNFTLNICVNYGGRQEIVKAAREIAIKSLAGEIKPSEIDEQLFNSQLLTHGIKDPELLIRTSGEKRISNFLLWQLAYSEIYITDVLWPDFNEIEFFKAIIDYQSRDRRFGGIQSLPNKSCKDSNYSS
ncbi:Undecaprenyl pyrophosphate synthetase (UPPS) [Prochlorococcus marinus str. MIT 9515]|uniref:Isoprenyl transferase n=1 Tax=Prochlorococcus marinus (strain MIT 9515) TaxID=167542 RepID=A2BX79_PROM5|nr:isoprenyl transferase [Prochlorococcus marinus]ABM72390.1 Undecaprenyl pyrophosphate synthetase (UPPS) [Prochlorococcus marinus str. MIT 9515]